jgi:F-type H+-transporting ATPase subunit b
MLTNWFTIAAQIINFLLLVWLLKRFLYGRIIAAINKREGKIATALSEADAKEKAAAEQLALYQAKVEEFERLRDNLLAEARLDAEKQHAELIEKAREHARSLESAWREDLEHERAAFLLDLKNRAAAEILAIARRTVADLACLDVQQCAVQTFLEKLRLLDRDVCKSLVSKSGAASDLVVRSAFELSEDTQAEIRQTIEERLETPVCLRFERAPDMGLGVEVRGNGTRIGWNSESYLEALERDLAQALARGHTEAS